MNREDKKQAALGYVFLLPSLVMFAVFMFYPLFYTLYLSFFEWNMVKPVKKFVGLGNYISVLKDPNTWKIFGNTFWYIVILLVFNFVMPYILSFILSCVIKKGQSFYKAVFFLPSVIPLVRPSIISTGIIFFINSWNEYVWPVLILKSKENYTLSLALQMYISAEGGTEFTIAMAVSVLTMLIPLVLYIIFQRYIINTFAASGLKG